MSNTDALTETVLALQTALERAPIDLEAIPFTDPKDRDAVRDHLSDAREHLRHAILWYRQAQIEIAGCSVAPDASLPAEAAEDVAGLHVAVSPEAIAETPAPVEGA